MHIYTVAVQPTTPVQPVYQCRLRSWQEYERRQHGDETRVKQLTTMRQQHTTFNQTVSVTDQPQ